MTHDAHIQSAYQAAFRFGRAAYERGLELDACAARAVVALKRMGRRAAVVQSPTEQPQTVTASSVAQETAYERLAKYAKSLDYFTAKQAALDLGMSVETVHTYMHRLKRSGHIKKDVAFGSQLWMSV